MLYTTNSLIKYLCRFICGGHNDSYRIAVLVMVSKAESIVLYLSSCSSIMYRLAKLKISFLPSEFFTRDRRRPSI